MEKRSLHPPRLKSAGPREAGRENESKNTCHQRGAVYAKAFILAGPTRTCPHPHNQTQRDSLLAGAGLEAGRKNLPGHLQDCLWIIHRQNQTGPAWELQIVYLLSPARHKEPRPLDMLSAPGRWKLPHPHVPDAPRCEFRDFSHRATFDRSVRGELTVRVQQFSKEHCDGE